MRNLFSLFLLLFSFTAKAQVFVDVDTSKSDIRYAVEFLIQYLDEFKGGKYPDYKNYWSGADLRKSKVPDDMVHAITTDGATYNFSKKPTVFYAHSYKDYVHLKVVFASVTDSNNTILWAITNHYVYSDSSGKRFFVSELEHKSKNYTTLKNGNITYHFPVSHKFNKAKSDSLIKKIKKMETEWELQPIMIGYYFADSKVELYRMRGMDYCLGMDNLNPSGMSFPETRTIFCEGLGEDYFHEVLHLYFNPLYEKSPLNHGMIYYLADGIGKDFKWILNRMNDYLKKYPNTDFSEFEKLQLKESFVSVDYVVTGLVCKIIYEKEGVKGLKRLLAYKTFDEAIEKEFSVERKELDSFLKDKIREKILH